MSAIATAPAPIKERLAATRLAGYARNMEAMRLFKETHPCADCGKTFPHYVMDFAPPKDKAAWTISRLAGSRCNLSALEEAMKGAEVLCSNCKRIRDFLQ